MSRFVDKPSLVNLRILQWFREGKSLPGYDPGNGHPYLNLLLGRSAGEANVENVVYFIKRKYPQLYDQLLGPHGWTVMRALQVQAVQRTESEKACLAVKGEDKCY